MPKRQNKKASKNPNAGSPYSPRRDQAETHDAFMAEVAAVNRRIDDDHLTTKID